MRLNMRLRVHEWLADRFSWVQYPDLRKEHARQARPKVWKPSLWWRYKAMTWRQLGWFWFAVFWTVMAMLMFIGPGA